MTSTLFSLTLSLSLLALLALVSLYNLKVLKPALEALKQALTLNLQLEKQRDKALSQALNLLASKEPMAYQMLQAGTPEPIQDSVYNGPYVTGEEYQQLLDYEKRITDMFNVEGNDGD